MTSLAASKGVGSHPGSTAHLLAENEALRLQLRQTQKLATVGTMTAMIVHEFNNILTPIINYAQLAAGGDPEMTAKAIAKAADGGKRATDICNALLRMLRKEEHELSEVTVRDLVADALLSMGRDLGKDGINLIVDVPPALQMTTRPAEIKQVLVNLLLNSRAACLQKGRGGEIVVRAARKGRKIRISVADTGCGIDPVHREQIFQPFFTTKNGENGREKGTGLGLAMCLEIVTDMGGEILVDSTAGRGATFTVVLPT